MRNQSDMDGFQFTVLVIQREGLEVFVPSEFCSLNMCVGI